MPPRVTYWTGVWDPAQEAISKEIEALRHRLPESPVVSFSAGQRSSVRLRDGVVKLSSRRWLALRALAALVEPRGDVTHVFGGFMSWHLLRAVGRRPVIFTVAVQGSALDARLCAKVSLFVAETEPLAQALRGAGVPSDRIRVIYPGVDLDLFAAAPPQPLGPFRLLFASSPATPSEFDSRGIPLLIALARRCPDVEVVLAWRQWGPAVALRQALEELSPPRNVIVMEGEASMADLYRSAHATVCCYAPGFGKSCPNSVVESLATARPAVVSRTCGIAKLVTAHAAGVAVEPTVEALVDAIAQIRKDLPGYSSRARSLAEAVFGLESFRRVYGELYESLA